MPVDPTRVNEYGDLVLRELAEFVALADPARLALFDSVRRSGPISTADLAAAVGAAPREVADDLVRLEEAGLIDRTDERWTSDVQGTYFEIPDEEELQRAARRLSSVMLASYAGLPGEWVEHDEPSLSVEWARAAGLFNARVAITEAELRGVQDELERVLAPFTTRTEADTPADAAEVRVLAFFMPRARVD